MIRMGTARRFLSVNSVVFVLLVSGFDDDADIWTNAASPQSCVPSPMGEGVVVVCYWERDGAGVYCGELIVWDQGDRYEG